MDEQHAGVERRGGLDPDVGEQREVAVGRGPEECRSVRRRCASRRIREPVGLPAGLDRQSPAVEAPARRRTEPRERHRQARKRDFLSDDSSPDSQHIPIFATGSCERAPGGCVRNRPMGARMKSTKVVPRWMAASAVVVGLVAGGYGIANTIQRSGTKAGAATSGFTASRTAGADRADETPLTGDTLVEGDRRSAREGPGEEGRPRRDRRRRNALYEVHMRSRRAPVTVHVDKAFGIVSVDTDRHGARARTAEAHTAAVAGRRDRARRRHALEGQRRSARQVPAARSSAPRPTPTATPSTRCT